MVFQLKTIRKSQVVRSATEDDSHKSREDVKAEDVEAPRDEVAASGTQGGEGLSVVAKHDEGDDGRNSEQPKKLLDIARQAETRTEKPHDASVIEKQETRRQIRNEEHARILEKCKEERSTKENTEEEECAIESKKDATDENATNQKDTSDTDDAEEKVAEKDVELTEDVEEDDVTDDGNLSVIFLTCDCTYKG